MNLPTTGTKSVGNAKGSNIIAMDRGYWNRDLIEYLSSNGFQLIGTHKRTK